MQLTIKHNINYFFKGIIKTGFQKVLLKPKQTPFQKITKWDINIIGGIKEISSLDQFDNNVDIFRLQNNVNSIQYIINGIVETKKNNGITSISKKEIPFWCYLNNYELTKPGSNLIKFYQDNLLNKDDLINSLHNLSKKIREIIKYKKGKTNYDTNAEEAFIKGYGVCQDHTHIFLSLVRQNNLPCRYISGYFIPIKKTKTLNMHAWAEVYIKNLGWVGFDISNGISPNERYIVVAKGFDFNSVSPIKGIINGFVKESLKSNLKIENINQ